MLHHVRNCERVSEALAEIADVRHAYMPYERFFGLCLGLELYLELCI